MSPSSTTCVLRGLASNTINTPSLFASIAYACVCHACLLAILSQPGSRIGDAMKYSTKPLYAWVSHNPTELDEVFKSSDLANYTLYLLGY